jgi:hypothetical protein
MKFVCLPHATEKDWEAFAKGEPEALVEEWFAYDAQLRKNGHWLAGGNALQSARSAKTLRWKDGKVIVTDGPFAETKELLGGFGLLEASDMEQAVELMSKHPAIRLGVVEIRPVNEESLQRQREWEESPKGRGVAAAAQGSPGAAQSTPGAAAGTAGKTERFACLGYLQEGSWDSIAPCEREAMMAEVIAFDGARRKSGHWISGIGLRGAGTAKTLRSTSGKAVVTDGPYAETKEQLGGVVVNAIEDMYRAVELLSTHPALRMGVVIEIRPIDEDMKARWETKKARAHKQ